MSECKLTERMILQKFESAGQDEDGFPTEPVWNENYYPCWCKFRTVSGKEYFSAKANNTENIVTFTVRYCNKTKALLVPGATKEYRLFYQDNIYDIQFASDFQDAHEWIDIKCTIKA